MARQYATLRASTTKRMSPLRRIAVAPEIEVHEGCVDINPIPVVLVDDFEIWRSALKEMLTESEFEVVGEASTCVEALDVIAAMAPRIVMLDMRLAGTDSYATLSRIKSNSPDTSIIVLSAYSNSTLMARALAGGASGYILKSSSRSDLLHAMRSIALGGILLTHDDLAHCLRYVHEMRSDDTGLPDALTPREEEVLSLLATGLSNRDIATVLFITEQAAVAHVSNIVSKTGVSDRVQAAIWAARNGYA